MDTSPIRLENLNRSYVIEALIELTNPTNDRWFNEVRLKSYRHANGFAKIVLGTDTDWTWRLHVWEANSTFNENIHTHRWYLISHILSGTMRETRFALSGPQQQKFRGDLYQVWNSYPRDPETQEIKIKLESDQPYLVQPNGPQRVFKPGDIYESIAGEFHRTDINNPPSMVVTSCLTGLPTLDCARVLFPTTEKPQTSVASREIPYDEFYILLRRVIEVLS